MLLIRRVHGNSMRPVLLPGSVVIALEYVPVLRGRYHMFSAGNVVVLAHDGMEKIKRIVAVRQRGGRPEIYVRGDNDAFSTDSRHFGWLPADSVKGKVIWPHTKAR